MNQLWLTLAVVPRSGMEGMVRLRLHQARLMGARVPVTKKMVRAPGLACHTLKDVSSPVLPLQQVTTVYQYIVFQVPSYTLLSSLPFRAGHRTCQQLSPLFMVRTQFWGWATCWKPSKMDSWTSESECWTNCRRRKFVEDPAEVCISKQVQRRIDDLENKKSWG
jgi:hypothetical protein